MLEPNPDPNASFAASCVGFVTCRTFSLLAVQT